MWHALTVHICLVCFANILGVVYWLFYRRIWTNSCLGVNNSMAIFSFCTHLTFDLILRLRHISRLDIHPYDCWHTSRNTISMDATFYSILPPEEFFHGMDCQLWGRISYFDIRNHILTFALNVKILYSASVSQCECRNRILNVKIRYSASMRMSK